MVVVLASAIVVPAASAQRPRTWNTTPVGHLDPGGGFVGDVTVHGGFAYLGSWGLGRHCPAHGVRAVNVGDPSRPRVSARFARFRGASSEDVWVGSVSTGSFTGDLAAVGIQRCVAGNRAFGGLALFDVTAPARPRLLGRLAVTRRMRGVHELSVVQRADGRVLALLSVPHSYEATARRKGDVRIVDVSDPRRPRELASWDVRRNAPAPVRRSLRGRDHDELLAHSVSAYAGGQRAFVSHWDAGAVFLDLAEPERPRYLGRTAYRARAFGNAHSGAFRASGTDIFVQNDEVGDFYHSGIETAWGFQRIWDVGDPGRPRSVGRFATESSVPGRDGRIRRDGFYSVHNNVFVGDVEVVSWYSDGVRIVDLSRPERPRAVGLFVPPPRRDPQGYWVAPNGNRRFPLVWGVAVSGGLVYASDINSGLWIFRSNAIRGTAG